MRLADYLATQSTQSRHTVAAALDRAAAILGAESIDTVAWDRMNATTIASAFVAAAAHYSPATLRQTASCLRGWLRYLGAEDPLASARMAHYALSIPKPKGKRPMRGRALTRREVADLFTCASKAPEPSRDACVLALGLFGGLRRAEIAALQWSDVLWTDGAVRVHGKGDRVDDVPLPLEAIDALRDHLAAATCALGRVPAPHDSVLGLTSDGVRYAYTALARDARLPSTACHDMRRTYITEGLEQSGDLAAVQYLARHASPLTTTRYAMALQRAARRVALSLPCPYRSPPPAFAADALPAPPPAALPSTDGSREPTP